MTKRRTLKHRKSLRRAQRVTRRYSGGGWGDLPKGPFNEIAVNPGNQVHFPFSGPGKDCTGNPHSIRPGYIAGYSPNGLPGFSGGARRRHSRKKHHSSKRRYPKSYGGMAMPAVASYISSGPITNPNLPPVNGSVTPKPGDFPDTTGAGGTVANPNPSGLPVVMSMPGVPTPGAAQMPKMPIAELTASTDGNNLVAPKQAGGRYGFFPGMGPLNPLNGVGTTLAPFGRIPCETGTFNPLNPNPGDIQRLSTAPLTPPFVTGRLAGGALSGAPTNVGSSGFSAANFPTVQVGNADSMRYYAPTAGYRNDFQTFGAPSPTPGYTIQTPYDARAFNQACIKTGGSYKNKNKVLRNGGGPVAFDAGIYTPVTMSEIMTRKDFDGSNQGLPVKFGGKRRSHKTTRTRKGSKKSKKNYKGRKYHK